MPLPPRKVKKTVPPLESSLVMNTSAAAANARGDDEASGKSLDSVDPAMYMFSAASTTTEGHPGIDVPPPGGGGAITEQASSFVPPRKVENERTGSITSSRL